MKKISSLLLTVLLFSFMLTGCSFFGGGEKIDEDTLYVGVFQGGFGRVWLDKTIEAYVADNPDKKVAVVEKHTEYTNESFENNISNYPYDLFFLNDMTQDTFIRKGLFADMTDIVTEKVYDDNFALSENGTKSIEDSMIEDYKNVYKRDNKYYAIPFLVSPYGIVYDADLFSDGSFYFDANGNFVGGDGAKSIGRDGIAGTFDDGLPETMSDLKTLTNEMFTANITPFTWAGETTYQRQHILEAVWASYNGKSDYSLNYSLSGTDSVLGEINLQNATILQQQQGKKAAIAFAKYLTDDPVRYNTSKTLSHTAAQENYLSSEPRSKNNASVKQIAMLIEGGFWENEARENLFFDQIAKQYKNDKYAYGTREFGFMPIPVFDNSFNSEGVEAQTSSEYNMFMWGSQSLVCMNATTKKADMAKDFLQYCQSSKGLDMFTRYSGCIRPYNYELTQESYNSLTNYSKTVWDAYKSSEVTKVYDLYDNILYDYFRSSMEQWDWGSQMSGSQVAFSEPFDTFMENSNISVNDYFNGLTHFWTNTTNNRWQTILNFFEE